MSNKKILQNRLRLLDIELSNQTIDMNKAMQAAADLEQAVSFSREQIALLTKQIEQCPE